MESSRKSKLAIVGFASTTRKDAPLSDPEWDVWECNQLGMILPGNYTARFELHHLTEIAPENLDWLKKSTIPVYMIEKHADIPMSVRFPIETIEAEFPRGYWCSSIAYMLAFGMIQGYETIGVWGVDMAMDSEYQYQRPNAEYFMGIAEGRGIELIVPEASLLLKSPWRYGYEQPPVGAYDTILGALTKQRQVTLKDLADHRATARFCEGADHALKWAISQVESAQREVYGCTVGNPIATPDRKDAKE
mgnify:FL=1